MTRDSSSLILEQHKNIGTGTGDVFCVVLANFGMEQSGIALAQHDMGKFLAFSGECLGGRHFARHRSHQFTRCSAA